VRAHSRGIRDWPQARRRARYEPVRSPAVAEITDADRDWTVWMVLHQPPPGAGPAGVPHADVPRRASRTGIPARAIHAGMEICLARR
jgi:hypothetical protein